MISRVLVATCQVLPAKKTDQWDVWNKEPICGTCNWHTCYLWGDMWQILLWRPDISPDIEFVPSKQ